MPKIEQIREWWKYEKSVFFKTCHETSRASFGRGLLVTLAAAIGRWWFGFMAQHEIWAQIFIFVGAGMVVYLGEFLIRLFYAPAKMEKEAKEKLDRVEKIFAEVDERNKIAHEKQIELMEGKIQLLQSQLESLCTPLLEIESVDSDIPGAQKHLCQIRIINRSPTVTADNVKVELVALEDDLKNSVQGQYFRPAFPIILNSQTGENIINPGSPLVYRLFHVMMNDGWLRQENSQEMIPYRAIIAYFTPGQTTQNVTQFLWKKDYRLKLRATARDFSKTEQGFNLTFSDKGKFCGFSLTKIT